jgi:hypothetical protein
MVALSFVCLVYPGSLFAETQEDGAAPTLDVYVTPGVVPAVDSAKKKELQKELSQKAKVAKDQKKALEKQLKAELGKDKDKWPPEKQEELRQAEDVEKMILMELESLDLKQKDLDDTAEDIKRSIQGEGMAKAKKHIRLVEAAEGAALRVEVMGRRKEGSGGLVACATCYYYVYLKITPGVGFNAETFSQIAPKGGFLDNVRRIHQYRADEPFWIIEAGNTGRWGNAANQGAGALNDFIEENMSALTTQP